MIYFKCSIGDKEVTAMRSIAREIARAIKEAKWVYLIYENKESVKS